MALLLIVMLIIPIIYLESAQIIEMLLILACASIQNVFIFMEIYVGVIISVNMFSAAVFLTVCFVSAAIIKGEYAYALVLLLIPLAMQGRRLTALNEDNTLLSAVLVVGAFEVFGAIVLLIASAWQEPTEEALGVYLGVIDVAGYLVVLAVRACVPTPPMKGLNVPSWEGPKTVMACLLGYSCTVTALLSWQLAAIMALLYVPLLVMARPFKKRSVSSWCMVLAMIVSSPARWSSILGCLTAYSSGTGVVLQWLRWFRLSRLLNLPLMCLVLMPAHLTIAFVIYTPRSHLDVPKSKH